MNISEALKHLIDGKKIKHEGRQNDIYAIHSDKLYIYKKEDLKDEFYSLCLIGSLPFTTYKINGWSIVTEPLNIKFQDCYTIGAFRLVTEGHTIKRLKTGECYNNTYLADNSLTMEDIEANDWVVAD